MHWQQPPAFATTPMESPVQNETCTLGSLPYRREGKGKFPMRVRLKNQRTFTFAGLWDLWRDPEGGELYSFTIITTEANKLLRPIHNRMPMILDDLAAKQWLDPIFTSLRTLAFLLQPFPSELMEAYEVSRLVNDPKNDSPACIERAVPERPASLFDRWPNN
jgi:putative SOS response-associated peptidase YedK